MSFSQDMKVPNETWRSACMTVSSCPLPVLPMGQWLVEQLLECGLGAEGGGWQAGLCTCFLYIPAFTTMLNPFIGCPDWKVPNETQESGCITVSSHPFPLLPVWAMARGLANQFQPFFWGMGVLFKYIYSCFYFLIIIFHWVPVLHLDVWVASEPCSSVCAAVSSPPPFICRQ